MLQKLYGLSDKDWMWISITTLSIMASPLYILPSLQSLNKSCFLYMWSTLKSPIWLNVSFTLKLWQFPTFRFFLLLTTITASILLKMSCFSLRHVLVRFFSRLPYIVKLDLKRKIFIKGQKLVNFVYNKTYHILIVTGLSYSLI